MVCLGASANLSRRGNHGRPTEPPKPCTLLSALSFLRFAHSSAQLHLFYLRHHSCVAPLRAHSSLVDRHVRGLLRNGRHRPWWSPPSPGPHHPPRGTSSSSGSAPSRRPRPHSRTHHKATHSASFRLGRGDPRTRPQNPHPEPRAKGHQAKHRQLARRHLPGLNSTDIEEADARLTSASSTKNLNSRQRTILAHARASRSHPP